MRLRGTTWLAVGLTAALVSGPGIAHAAKPAQHGRLSTITIPVRRGAINSKWLTYSGAPRADVLRPAHYDPHRAYRLVVVLGGLGDNYSWYADWGFTKLFGRLNAIIVMPEGASGWYTDWWNNGRRGGPSWETYELDDVLPAIEHRYLIKPQRRDHALVGISMGGLGATYLGGRLPGFFGSVATLSGFVDPGAFPAVVDPAVGLTSAALFKGDHNPDPVYGPPSGFYFKGHNPTQLAANLRHTRVFESTGNGVPSKSGLQHLTTGGTTAIPSGTALEAPIIHPMNQFYVRALRRVHVNVTYQDHPGGHDIPDFIDEVKAAIRWGLFKSVPEHPTRWTNDTVATHGSLWGIGYHFTRPPTRVVRFHRSGNRLSISRAGSSVTLRLAGGRVIRTRTPAIVRLR